MSVNLVKQNREYEFAQRVIALERTIQQMRTNQNSVMVVPRVTSDPTTLINGMMWYRTDTNLWKIYQNGTIRVI